MWKFLRPESQYNIKSISGRNVWTCTCGETCGRELEGLRGSADKLGLDPESQMTRDGGRGVSSGACASTTLFISYRSARCVRSGGRQTAWRSTRSCARCCGRCGQCVDKVWYGFASPEAVRDPGRTRCCLRPCPTACTAVSQVGQGMPADATPMPSLFPTPLVLSSRRGGRACPLTRTSMTPCHQCPASPEPRVYRRTAGRAGHAR
eukprot:146481-Chlamydomonas_euryale.AAC.3